MPEEIKRLAKEAAEALKKCPADKKDSMAVLAQTFSAGMQVMQDLGGRKHEAENDA